MNILGCRCPITTGGVVHDVSCQHYPFPRIHNIPPGTILPCPSCATLRAKHRDVEGMAKVIRNAPPCFEGGKLLPEDLSQSIALSAWLEEG